MVAADTLLPLSYPAFDTRVDAWDWVTTTRYEQCDVLKTNQPYRDFIRARFLWKERPHQVKVTQLPTNADTPDPTAVDGGALIFLHDGTSLGTGAQVRVELPAATDPPAGYPGRRRVCLSVPGDAGNHAVLEAGTNVATVAYASPDAANALHLVGEMPWFRLQLPAGTDIDDPWTYRIGYGVTTAAQSGQHLHEAITDTDVGPIERNGTHYGINQMGDDTRATMRAAYTDHLSGSRRLVIAGVLGAEAGPSAVSTHDGPKVSWGMNQWTWRATPPSCPRSSPTSGTSSRTPSSAASAATASASRSPRAAPPGTRGPPTWARCSSASPAARSRARGRRSPDPSAPASTPWAGTSRRPRSTRPSPDPSR